MNLLALGRQFFNSRSCSLGIRPVGSADHFDHLEHEILLREYNAAFYRIPRMKVNLHNSGIKNRKKMLHVTLFLSTFFIQPGLIVIKRRSNPMRALMIVTATALIAASSTVSAQPQFQAGGSFSLAYPQKDFKKNIGNTGIGAAGQFAYRFGGSPFLVGASLGFWIYGSDTQSMPFSETINIVTVDVTTTNSFFMGHLMLRVQPQAGAIRPYIDGLFGFNYLNTSTKISNQGYDSDGEDEIASSTNFDDVASNYGFGGGLMFCVYDAAAHGRESNLQGVFVDLGIRSLKGGKAEYMKIRFENDKYLFDKFKSETDLVTYHIGVSFDFAIHSHPTGD
jgi:hypothetical protein